MDHTSTELPKRSLKTYFPLFLILLFIIGGVGHLSWIRGSSVLWMSDFMGLFFLVFSFFKLLDLPGFVNAYKRYDIPSKYIPFWAWIYPFIELVFGVLYLRGINHPYLHGAVLFVLGISIIGVCKSVLGKQTIQCACLGVGFQLPMSVITIIEDLLMIGMALSFFLF